MKRTHISLIVIIIASVFMLSFLMGRALALKERNENSADNEIYMGTTLIPKDLENETAVETGSNAEKVPKEEKKSNIEKKIKSQETKPPERMLFPCGTSILNDYSQTAVYSKTMDDWRAHPGIDYAAKEGDDVVSTWDGTVTNVSKDKLWGYTVEIMHTCSIKSVYKNLEKKIFVKKGEKVSRGQKIGTVGTSSAVEKEEKPHLHFELWKDNLAINPQSYVY